MICDKIGHTFEGYEDLQDPIVIQKLYIHICGVIQKIKKMGAYQSQDVHHSDLLR